jgi:hypothetical protein
VFLLSPPDLPKGKNSMLQNRTFYFWEPPWFAFFWWWVNQIGSLLKQTNQRTNLEGTRLTNANHNGPDDKQTNKQPSLTNR